MYDMICNAGDSLPWPAKAEARMSKYEARIVTDIGGEKIQRERSTQRWKGRESDATQNDRPTTVKGHPQADVLP